MPLVIGHLKAKEFLLEKMLPVWDRFIADLRAADTHFTPEQALSLDELERYFDVAKMTPLRQANWYKRNRPTYKAPKKSSTKCRAEHIKATLWKSQEVARSMGMEVVIRQNYYVLLEQGREVLHSQSVVYFLELLQAKRCALEKKTKARRTIVD